MYIFHQSLNCRTPEGCCIPVCIFNLYCLLVLKVWTIHNILGWFSSQASQFKNDLFVNDIRHNSNTSIHYTLNNLWHFVILWMLCYVLKALFFTWFPVYLCTVTMRRVRDDELPLQICLSWADDSIDKLDCKQFVLQDYDTGEILVRIVFVELFPLVQFSWKFLNGSVLMNVSALAKLR